MRQLRISKSITKREAVSLEKYLQEIGKVSLITPEKEAELARRIKDGDDEALQQLAKANLRFVVSTAKQYQNQGLPLSDLINEGNIGLMKAARRFDETKGFKFISYAVWRIRQSILQALADQSRLVRMPSNKVSSLSTIKRTRDALEQEFEREATITEIAIALNETEENVIRELTSDVRHVSFDALMNEEDDKTFLDIYVDPKHITTDRGLDHNESLSHELAQVMSSLTDREVEILVLHFGIGRENPLSLEEIGERYSLSRERVRQILERAIHRLRRKSRSKHLVKYLG